MLNVLLECFRYLEKESDDELAYQPAPDSPAANKGGDDDNDDEDDPLDAFMAGVDKQVIFLVFVR